ncbi:myosin-10-like [Clytia hemisphaerica]|uniref:Myosin heavy chain n=2 Tax=Clytia hemisphaerica TaxID=252671 RepID=A0A7M5X753_9CNID
MGDDELKYLMVDRRQVSDPVAHAEWASKKLCWVPSEDHGFLSASIKKEDGDKVTVQLDGGKSATFHKDDIQRMNPPKFNKVEDMADLTCLNEASVLNNLKDRYFSDLIYTYSGLFCVVVNPYKRLPIYSEKVVALYKGKKRHEVPPHVYAIADSAFRSMLQDRENQSILCTGESGAGKTENTKKVIQYLTAVAGRNQGKVDTEDKTQGKLENQLLQANPILEAFGNAKTVKNDNSSRFGKFIRIMFDSSGFICGANIDQYLLEKARIVRQAPEERTFHIFYQLLLGASPEVKKQFLLLEPTAYNFMSNGTVSLANMDDRAEFKATLEAMRDMGITQEELDPIFKVISSLLLFGNMEFKQERKSDQATLPDNTIAQKICHLLGMPVTDFTKSLLKPRVKVGREFTQKAQTKAQCEFAIEAISKATYERLFKWLVGRINKSLNKGKRDGNSFIGILDIAGFEIFQLNSFEQLCINYTNEKLQQLFNHTMFVLEQEEYQKEGIDWKFIDFGLDLQPTIDLIEKPMGLLALLDEECWFPKATDKSLVDKLNKQHLKHPKYLKPDFRSNSDFCVIHYAGRVDYSATQWLTKNMDPLNDNIVSLMTQSKDSFISGLWKDVDNIVGMSVADSMDTAFGASRTKKGMFRTVSQLYKEQLAGLMNTLHSTKPNFVRCIIPNYEKRAGKIDNHLVLDQLRCNGVLEGIRICRQGFPNRILFQEFRQRYEILCPGIVPRGFMDGRKAAQQMIENLEMDPNLYRIGQSKIFFRAGVLAHLEEERDIKLTEIIVQFQAYCRGNIARRNYKKRIQQLSAIRVIQRNGRAWLKLRNWQWWRLFTKVKPLLNVTRQEDEMRLKEEDYKKLSDQNDKMQSQLGEITKTHEKLVEEKNSIAEQLQAEIELCQEAEEARNRLMQRKAELEDVIQDYEMKIQDEEDKTMKLSEEKKKLQVGIQDLEESLEEEEAQRQKLQLEKVQVEAKLKQLEDDKATADDSNAKLSHEKKQLEDRVNDISTKLSTEEEKAKQLAKQKAKQEAFIQELEEQISKGDKSTTDLQKEIRKLQQEIADLKHQLNEAHARIADLEDDVKRRDQELAAANKRGDEESSKLAASERAKRELQSQLDELRDDYDNEKSAKEKAERSKRDLENDLEDLRSELEVSADASVVQKDMQRKRDEDLMDLKRQVAEEAKEHEGQMASLRTKHNNLVEELNNQLDQFKRTKTSLEKNKNSLESENAELASDLQRVSSMKADAEKKNKSLDNQVNELTMIRAEQEESITKLDSTCGKLQKECDSLNGALEDIESKAANLERAKLSAEAQLEDVQDQLSNETRVKLQLQTKLREANDEANRMQEQLEDEEEERKAVQKALSTVQIQLEAAKKELEISVGGIEEAEAAKQKQKRENDELRADLEKVQADYQRSEKVKKKLQGELDDANVQTERERQNAAQISSKQRKFDTQLAEERAQLEALRVDRDNVEKQARANETKVLSFQNLVAELEDKLADSERLRKNQASELQDLVDTKDDVGKSVHELEKTKRLLEQQLNEQKTQVEELEDELQATEDAKLRLEVNLQAAKAQFERDLAAKEDSIEEGRRSLVKQLREMEEELEDERKARQSISAAKRKLEGDNKDLEGQLEQANRIKEEGNKQLKKYQQQLKDVQRDLEDSRQSRDDLANQVKENEKKLKTLESDFLQMQEDLSAAERARRTIEQERDELLEELNNNTSAKQAVAEERKRWEAQIAALEEDLEEERTQTELMQDKVRRSNLQLEQMQAELNEERSAAQSLDNTRMQLERQNKDLQGKLADMESSLRSRNKNVVATMESKINNLEIQLDQEAKDRQQLSKNLRKSDKKIKDLNIQIEEERAHTDSYKQQVDKVNARLKNMKRQLDETEEEVTRLNSAKRKLQRDLDESNETLESSQREVNQLRQRMKGGVGARSTTSRRRAKDDEDEDDEEAAE